MTVQCAISEAETTLHTPPGSPDFPFFDRGCLGILATFMPPRPLLLPRDAPAILVIWEDSEMCTVDFIRVTLPCDAVMVHPQ